MHDTRILCGDGNRFTAVARVTEFKPRAHSASAERESLCNQCPMEVKASSKNASTFFHLSFKVMAKKPEQAAAVSTTLGEDSVSAYVSKYCDEGTFIRAFFTVYQRVWRGKHQEH